MRCNARLPELHWVGMLNVYNDVEQKMSSGAGMRGLHFLLKTLRNSLLTVSFVGLVCEISWLACACMCVCMPACIDRVPVSR
jgi:hypothetical protein